VDFGVFLSGGIDSSLVSAVERSLHPMFRPEIINQLRVLEFILHLLRQLRLPNDNKSASVPCLTETSQGLGAIQDCGGVDGTDIDAPSEQELPPTALREAKLLVEANRAGVLVVHAEQDG
jgi:hypothetical protein